MLCYCCCCYCFFLPSPPKKNQQKIFYSDNTCYKKYSTSRRLRAAKTKKNREPQREREHTELDSIYL